MPDGPYIRNDSGCYEGAEIPVHYDPMISKLVVWGEDRARAVARMRRALDEYQVRGIETNLAFHRRCLRHAAFVAGDYDTGFIGRNAAELAPRADECRARRRDHRRGARGDAVAGRGARGRRAAGSGCCCGGRVAVAVVASRRRRSPAGAAGCRSGARLGVTPDRREYDGGPLDPRTIGAVDRRGDRPPRDRVASRLRSRAFRR